MADPRTLLDAKIKNPNSTLDNSDISAAIGYYNDDINAFNQHKTTAASTITDLLANLGKAVDVKVEPGISQLQKLNEFQASLKLIDPLINLRDPTTTSPIISDLKLTLLEHDKKIKAAQTTLDTLLSKLPELEQSITDSIENAATLETQKIVADYNVALKEARAALGLNKTLSNQVNNADIDGLAINSSAEVIKNFEEAGRQLQTRITALEGLDKINDSADNEHRLEFKNLEGFKTTATLIQEEKTARENLIAALNKTKQDKITELKNKYEAAKKITVNAFKDHINEATYKIYVAPTPAPATLSEMTSKHVNFLRDIGKLYNPGAAALSIDSSYKSILDAEKQINDRIKELETVTKAAVDAYKAERQRILDALEKDAAASEDAAVQLRRNLTEGAAENLRIAGLLLTANPEIDSISEMTDLKQKLKDERDKLDAVLNKHAAINLKDDTERATFAANAAKEVHEAVDKVGEAISAVNTRIYDEWNDIRQKELLKFNDVVFANRNASVAVYNGSSAELKGKIDAHADSGEVLRLSKELVAFQGNLNKPIERPKDRDAYIPTLVNLRDNIQKAKIDEKKTALDKAVTDVNTLMKAYQLQELLDKTTTQKVADLYVEFGRADIWKDLPDADKAEFEHLERLLKQTPGHEAAYHGAKITFDAATNRSELSLPQLSALEIEIKRDAAALDTLVAKIRPEYQRLQAAANASAASVAALAQAKRDLIDKIDQVMSPASDAFKFIVRVNDNETVNDLMNDLRNFAKDLNTPGKVTTADIDQVTQDVTDKIANLADAVRDANQLLLKDDIDDLVGSIDFVTDIKSNTLRILTEISQAKDPKLQKYETDIRALLKTLSDVKANLTDPNKKPTRDYVDSLLDDNNGLPITINELIQKVSDAQTYAAPQIAKYVGSVFQDYADYINVIEASVDTAIKFDPTDKNRPEYTNTLARINRLEYELETYRIEMANKGKNKEAQLALNNVHKLQKIRDMLTTTPPSDYGVRHFSDKSEFVKGTDLPDFEKNIEQKKKDILKDTDFDPTPGGGAKNIISSRAASAAPDRFTRGFTGLSSLNPFEGRVNHNVSTDGKTASLSVQRVKDGECITEKSFLSKNGKEVYDDSPQRENGDNIFGPFLGYKFSSDSVIEDAIITVLEHVYANQSESIRKKMVDASFIKIINGEEDPVLRQAAKREVLDVRGSFKDTYAQAIMDVCKRIGAESHDKRNPRGRNIIADKEMTDDRNAAFGHLLSRKKDKMLTKVLGAASRREHVADMAETTKPRAKL